MTQRVRRAGSFKAKLVYGGRLKPLPVRPAERSPALVEAAEGLAAEASNLALYAEMAKHGVSNGWEKFDREVEDLKEAIAAYEAAKREVERCSE